MLFLMVLLALGMGYGSTVVLVLAATFAIGAGAPATVLRGDRLRTPFLLANLIVWMVAAAIGATVAALISPFGRAPTYTAFAALLAAVVLSSAVQRRKQQSLPYQLVVVLACLAGVFASMKGLPLFR